MSSSSSSSNDNKDAAVPDKQQRTHYELHQNKENNSAPLTVRRGVAPLQVTAPTAELHTNNIAASHVTPSTTASSSSSFAYSFPISQRGMSRPLSRRGGRVSPHVMAPLYYPPQQHQQHVMPGIVMPGIILPLPYQTQQHQQQQEYAINATMTSMDAALTIGRQAILGPQNHYEEENAIRTNENTAERMASAESMLALRKSPPKKRAMTSVGQDETSKRQKRYDTAAAGLETTDVETRQQSFLSNEPPTASLPICEQQSRVDDSSWTAVSTPSRSTTTRTTEPRLSSGKRRKERIIMPLLSHDVVISSDINTRKRKSEYDSSDSSSD